MRLLMTGFTTEIGDAKKPLAILATDGIVEYDDGKQTCVVLIERLYEPYGIALPGGKQEYGLTLTENVVKEIKEETNLQFQPYGPPLCERSAPDRDPRHHVISITYVGRGTGVVRGGDDAKAACAYSLPELERLIACERRTRDVFAFKDHVDILEQYLAVRDIIERNTDRDYEEIVRQFTGTWIDDYQANNRRKHGIDKEFAESPRGAQ
jgi:8-oxo-dGTP diphosphatase